MRLLFASIHSYLDPASGAAISTRELLEALATLLLRSHSAVTDVILLARIFDRSQANVDHNHPSPGVQETPVFVLIAITWADAAPRFHSRSSRAEASPAPSWISQVSQPPLDGLQFRSPAFDTPGSWCRFAGIPRT